MKANELMNDWLENSKAAMEPARRLGDIAQRAMEKVSEQNLAMVKEYMEMNARALQLMTSVRDPRALVTEQVTLAKELGDKILANAELFGKLATETQAELVKWAEDATEAAVAKAEEAVEKAA